MKRIFRVRRAAVVLVALLSAGICRAEQHGEPVVTFSIPTGEAQKTLQLYYAQSNVQMLYLTENVVGVKTNAVSGKLGVTAALAEMLQGTSLETSFEENYTFVSVTPSVLPGMARGSPAAVAIDLPNPGVTSTAPINPILRGFESIAEVVVTGTMLHGVEDIYAPLEVLSRAQLRTARGESVHEALALLPVSRGGGPSEDFGGQGNFSRGSAINLRGLGAGATLVLLNGRRQPYAGADGGFVDVESIPRAGIDHIDVLADGASAIYGSDAVAGVVNVVMRKDVARPESVVRYSTGNDGGVEKSISQVIGDRWESGRALLTLEYRDRTALPATARAYTRSSDKRSLGGSDFRSYYSSPANWLDAFSFEPKSGLIEIPQGSAASQATSLTTLNREDRLSHMQILPSRETYAGFLSAEQGVTDALSVSLDARWTVSAVRQHFAGFYELLFVPRSNPYVGDLANDAPYALLAYDFRADVGLTGLEAKTRTGSATVALNLDLGGTWKATLSNSYGTERTAYSVLNNIDVGRLDAALASSDPSLAFNPFSPGQNSKAVIDSILLDEQGRSASVVRSLNVTADGPIGPINLALGAENRDESLSPSSAANPTSMRAVRSIFAEVRVPILGGSRSSGKSSSRLEVSLSGRVEDYSDVGRTSNPRVALSWTPRESIKLRGSLGKSFKAPKLADVHDSASNFSTLIALADRTSPTGQSLVLARLGDNPELQDERARTWTAGFDFAPSWAKGLTGSVTYYDIDYSERVVDPGITAGAAILLEEGTWADLIDRNPARAAVEAICTARDFRGPVEQCLSAPLAALVDFRLRNMARTEVRGVDLRLDERLDSHIGRFVLSASAGYMFAFQQAVSPRSALISAADTVGNPLRRKAMASVDWYQTRWDGPGFGANLTVSHLGAYRDEIEARPVGSLSTADLHLSYRAPNIGGDRRFAGRGLFSDTEIAMDIVNMFSTAPPFINTEAGYDVLNADPVARSVSFRVEKRW